MSLDLPLTGETAYRPLEATAGRLACSLTSMAEVNSAQHRARLKNRSLRSHKRDL